MKTLFENNAKYLNTAGTNQPVSVPVYQLPGLSELITSNFRGPTLLIMDQEVQGSPCIARLKDLLDEMPFVYTVASGEHAKSIDGFAKLTQELRQIFEAKRSPPRTVVAVGGGTLINVANAAMAQLTGRINFLGEEICQPIEYDHYLVLPSTVLAVADVALGSKGNINSHEKKHAFRSYFEPSAIMLDPKILESLSVVEIKRGLVECLKHAILQDDSYGIGAPQLRDVLSMLRRPDPPSDLAFALASLTMYAKAAVLGRDTFEKSWKGGLLLSYGHLHAHAWESSSGFQVSHGDAVLFGMLVDLKLNGDPELYKLILSVVPFTPLKDAVFDHTPSRQGLASAYAQETKPFYLDANGAYKILKVTQKGDYQAARLDAQSAEPSKAVSIHAMLEAVDAVVADIRSEIESELNRSWWNRLRHPDYLAYMDI